MGSFCVFQLRSETQLGQVFWKTADAAAIAGLALTAQRGEEQEKAEEISKRDEEEERKKGLRKWRKGRCGERKESE